MVRESIVNGLKRLTPPEPNADHREVQSWRWYIAILTGATAMSLMGHIALACGFIPVVHPGFALASDIQQLKYELRESREADLTAKILDTRQKQCAATGTVKLLYTEALTKLTIQYWNTTNRQYPLPDCSDFA